MLSLRSLPRVRSFQIILEPNLKRTVHNARLILSNTDKYVESPGKYHRRWHCDSPTTFELHKGNANTRYFHGSCVLKEKQITQKSERYPEDSIKSEPDESKSEQKLTQAQKLRKVFAEYGATGIVFHTCISLTSLGICYAAVSSGIDVPGILQKIGFSESVTSSTVASGASTFVIAYACHKVFVPVRMFLTATCTPLIVRRLRTIGFLKVPVK